MKKSLSSLTGIMLAAFLFFALPVLGQNIITFGANSTANNACTGGAVICSTNGTTGYLNTNGTGQAFDLSTITSWFQIDSTGMNLLSTQTAAEPDLGAGGFLVMNDTGKEVDNFSLTLTDTFNISTPSVGPCTGAQAGSLCDKFTAHGGSGDYTYSTMLSGPTWDSCTQGTTVGTTCTGGPGGVAATFAPNTVTYTWTALPGQGVANGADFLITFASWQNNNNSNTTPPTVPEGSGVPMLGASGLVLFGTIVMKRRLV